MSVQVQNLTKIYGQQKAINNISFEVKKGEIVGFLGPNGAGKTTTMKILSCFIPQTEGTAQVCGYSTQTHSLEVRKLLGYLPEHNPLYLDMYVKEYLQFIANIHRIQNPKKRISEVIETVGLQREQAKKIAQLSKGYRQRVGLAQAIMHNPQVLILDEPTSGLDPNQLAEIRQVIKQLGKEKTVMLSTHIMQEVEAICDRILIINKGNLVANNTAQALQQQSAANTQTLITLEFLETINPNILTQIPDVEQVTTISPTQFQLLTRTTHDLRPQIFNFAVQNKLTLITLYKENTSLEEVFRQITQN